MPWAGTPAARSASRAPSAASTANARCTMTSMLNSVASQTSPGATRVEQVVLVEGEREQHHHDRRERQDLVDQDAAAQLDAQVLGGDQPGDAEARSWRSPRSGRRRRRPHGWPARRRARARGWPRSSLRPAAQAARSTVSSSSRPAASSPACGSSSSHSSARRAIRQASAVRRRCPAESLRTGTSPSRPPSPMRSSDGGDLGVGGPDRRPPERDVLVDGEVGVEAVGVAEQADTRRGRPGAAWRDRARAPPPCPESVAATRRRAAAAWSCRRRSGPCSSTISPR